MFILLPASAVHGSGYVPTKKPKLSPSRLTPIRTRAPWLSNIIHLAYVCLPLANNLHVTVEHGADMSSDKKIAAQHLGILDFLLPWCKSMTAPPYHPKPPSVAIRRQLPRKQGRLLQPRR